MRPDPADPRPSSIKCMPQTHTACLNIQGSLASDSAYAELAYTKRKQISKQVHLTQKDHSYDGSDKMEEQKYTNEISAIKKRWNS